MAAFGNQYNPNAGGRAAAHSTAMGSALSILDGANALRTVDEQNMVYNNTSIDQVRNEMFANTTPPNQDVHSMSTLQNLKRDSFKELNLAWVNLGKMLAPGYIYSIFPLEFTDFLTFKIRQRTTHPIRFEQGAEGTPVHQNVTSSQKSIIRLDRVQAGLRVRWEEMFQEPEEFLQRSKELAYGAAAYMEGQCMDMLMAQRNVNEIMATAFNPATTVMRNYLDRTSINFFAMAKSASVIENLFMGIFAAAQQNLGNPRLDTFIGPINMMASIKQLPGYRIYDQSGTPGGADAQNTIFAHVVDRQIAFRPYGLDAHKRLQDDRTRRIVALANFYVSDTRNDGGDIEIVDHQNTHDWVKLRRADILQHAGAPGQGDGEPIIVVRVLRLQTLSGAIVQKGGDTAINVMSIPILGRSSANMARQSDVVASFWSKCIPIRKNNMMVIPDIMPAGVVAGGGTKFAPANAANRYDGAFNDRGNNGRLYDLYAFPARANLETNAIDFTFKATDRANNAQFNNDARFREGMGVHQFSRMMRDLECPYLLEPAGVDQQRAVREADQFIIQRGAYRYRQGDNYQYKKNMGALGELDAPGNASRRLSGSFTVSLTESTSN